MSNRRKRNRSHVDYSRYSDRGSAVEETVVDNSDMSPLSEKQPPDTVIEELRAPTDSEMYMIETPLLNVRLQPSFTAEKAGYFKKKGEIAEITGKISDEDGTIWGKMKSGYYICLHDGHANVDLAKVWSER